MDASSRRRDPHIVQSVSRRYTLTRPRRRARFHPPTARRPTAAATAIHVTTVIAFTALVALAAFAAPRPAAAQIDPATLPEVGYHPGGIAYWDTPFFANAMVGGRWLEYEPGQWGADVSPWNNPQFDANGFPQYLNPGRNLRSILYALHSTYGSSRPPTWPDRSGLAQGHVVLAWRGDADIRLGGGGAYLDAESSGAATGSLVDGRRVYRFEGGRHVDTLEIHAINAADPITDIKVWLADPADPLNQSLEGHTFHPTFLARLADADWGFIRFMNFLETNANPQQEWSDRRPPTHAYQAGVLNPRAPADGHQGNRGSGMAYEYMAELCNVADKDLWVCVPHLASDDFIRKLARLIRFGSDGAEPYAAPVADPVHPPLAPHLRVYVEYSNEIWSSGHSFPQGDWAWARAQALGISKQEFNARRFSEVWRIFQQEFGGTARLVRVAAVFTAADWYTLPFLNELAAYGPTLSPPVEPDVIAVTTYFGNGIQDYVFDRAREQAGSDDPWFMTGAQFDAGGGNMHPVTLGPDDPYWVGADFERHMDEAFAEWRRRLLAGDAREGAGPDAVGVGGGFAMWLREAAQTTFATPRPLVAYEGGPSIYTDNRDWGPAEDDGITIFMEAFNRRTDFRDVYGIHLNMARSRGLRTHVIFTDCSTWGKYGQWGHLEYLDQPLAEAVKYSFILDWIEQMRGVAHIDDATGAVPSFLTDHNLPVVRAGEPFSVEIRVGGGDGARTIVRIGDHLRPGVAFDPLPGDPDAVRLHGNAHDSGLSYVYLRVVDADGDPAWRTFTLKAVGGPGTLLECDFSGADPARNLPWMATWVLDEHATFTGWQAGGGIVARDGDDALHYSVNAPADEADSTLERAVADDEYWAFTITPEPGYTMDLRGAEVRFTVRRIDYHCPRRYALMTDIGGFAAGAEHFVSDRDGGTDDQAYRFDLPDDPAFAGLAEPVEFRIYGFAGQYGGHRTSLRAFKLNGALTAPPPNRVRDVSWLRMD